MQVSNLVREECRSNRSANLEAETEQEAEAGSRTETENIPLPRFSTPSRLPTSLASILKVDMTLLFLLLRTSTNRRPTAINSVEAVE